MTDGQSDYNVASKEALLKLKVKFNNINNESEEEGDYSNENGEENVVQKKQEHGEDLMVNEYHFICGLLFKKSMFYPRIKNLPPKIFHS